MEIYIWATMLYPDIYERFIICDGMRLLDKLEKSCLIIAETLLFASMIRVWKDLISFYSNASHNGTAFHILLRISGDALNIFIMQAIVPAPERYYTRTGKISRINRTGYINHIYVVVEEECFSVS